VRAVTPAATVEHLEAVRLEALRAADGMRCRGCGCTEHFGCPDGCFWVTPDLCSSCASTDNFELPF